MIYVLRSGDEDSVDAICDEQTVNVEHGQTGSRKIALAYLQALELGDKVSIGKGKAWTGYESYRGDPTARQWDTAKCWRGVFNVEHT